MNNVVVFGLGLIAGGAVGAGITYICMKDKKQDYDEEPSRLSDHEDALRMTEDELREYYLDQLRDLGLNILDTSELDSDISYDQFKSLVNPIDDDEEEEEDEEYEDIAPIEPNPFPYVITSDEFDTKDSYSTATIHYYKEDGVFCDDGYDTIDNINDILGRTLDDIKTSVLDALYVRNEVQTCDYEILIFDDSYKHAVLGEEDQLGDMADKEES